MYAQVLFHGGDGDEVGDAPEIAHSSVPRWAAAAAAKTAAHLGSSACPGRSDPGLGRPRLICEVPANVKMTKSLDKEITVEQSQRQVSISGRWVNSKLAVLLLAYD